MEGSLTKMSGEEKAYNTAQRKNSAEKRGTTFTAQMFALAIVTALYLLTEFQLDALIYKGVGVIGYLFDQDWATPVQASLGTLKPAAFCASIGFLYYTLRQKV